MKPRHSNHVALTAVLLVAVALAAGGCCSGWKTITCPPDNEPVQILRNPENAYPVYAKSYEASIEATKETADGAKRRFGAVIEPAVVTLRKELDQESSQVQDILKTAVFALQIAPCDRESRREFSSLIQMVTERGIQITKLRLELEHAVEAGDSTAANNSVATTTAFFSSTPFR